MLSSSLLWSVTCLWRLSCWLRDRSSRLCSCLTSSCDNVNQSLSQSSTKQASHQSSNTFHVVGTQSGLSSSTLNGMKQVMHSAMCVERQCDGSQLSHRHTCYCIFQDGRPLCRARHIHIPVESRATLYSLGMQQLTQRLHCKFQQSTCCCPACTNRCKSSRWRCGAPSELFLWQH